MAMRGRRKAHSYCQYLGLIAEKWIHSSVSVRRKLTSFQLNITGEFGIIRLYSQSYSEFVVFAKKENTFWNKINSWCLFYGINPNCTYLMFYALTSENSTLAVSFKCAITNLLPTLHLYKKLTKINKHRFPNSNQPSSSFIYQRLNPS